MEPALLHYLGSRYSFIRTFNSSFHLPGPPFWRQRSSSVPISVTTACRLTGTSLPSLPSLAGSVVSMGATSSSSSLPAKEGNEGKLVPVNLQAVVTEIGTLELRCLQKGGLGKWKLELNVRMKE